MIKNLLTKNAKIVSSLLLGLISLNLCSSDVSAQDHGHLNIGAVSHQQGSQLIFENGNDFVPSIGYVKTLVFTNSGKYASKFQGNITLTALHAVDPFGEPVPNSPAPGSFIVGEIVSVEGPEGGAFEFWDATSTTEPTYSITTGTVDAQKFFEVSDASLGAGQPDGDPYGHIHGRRFTATKAGIYTVGFRAHDQSTQGADGGAIHQPSEVMLIRFQAGFNLLGVSLAANRAHVSFVSAAGFTWQLESVDQVNGTTWEPVGEPVAGDDMVETIADSRPLLQSRIYRLRGTPIQ